MKQVSIIIVTHNSEHHLYDCLTSIRQHADISLEAIELVIVDNCSRDADSMFLEARKIWGEDIVLIKNTQNGGYGQGNNLGIKAATAPLVLIMNPDVRLYAPVFSRAVRTFEQRPQLGILGMTQMFSPTRNSFHSVLPLLTVNGYLSAFWHVVCNRLGILLPSYVCIQGSCFFLRKAYFEQIGLFDEDHFMYGEEEDIHLRLKQAFGTSVFGFDKSLRYIHLTESRQFSEAYMQKMVRAQLALHEKKGISPRTILRHMLQNNRLLLWRQRLCHADQEARGHLLAKRRFLLSLLAEYE